LIVDRPGLESPVVTPHCGPCRRRGNLAGHLVGQPGYGVAADDCGSKSFSPVICAVNCAGLRFEQPRYLGPHSWVFLACFYAPIEHRDKKSELFMALLAPDIGF
jgi:hypothetical protein